MYPNDRRSGWNSFLQPVKPNPRWARECQARLASVVTDLVRVAPLRSSSTGLSCPQQRMLCEPALPSHASDSTASFFLPPINSTRLRRNGCPAKHAAGTTPQRKLRLPDGQHDGDGARSFSCCGTRLDMLPPTVPGPCNPEGPRSAQSGFFRAWSDSRSDISRRIMFRSAPSCANRDVMTKVDLWLFAEKIVVDFAYML